MRNEYLYNLKEEDISEGVIIRKLRHGKYKEIKALNIPGFGWVPCAKRLVEDMTTDPDELVIVHMEPEDENTGSDIWVTRTTSKIIAKVDLW